MSRIVPVILCGGVGSRLWPLSRKSLPKQFAQLIGEQSLFKATLKRVDNDAFAEPIVTTSRDHRFMVQKQMRECGCFGSILSEPESKNTGPAIFAAAHHLVKHSGDALLLIMPSDHNIPDHGAFVEMVLMGREAAEAGAIVTFGVAPDRPETGYGYIELSQQLIDDNFAVKGFHEKPNLATAKKMVDAGCYVWNAGIFLVRASAILAHAKNLTPDMLSAVQAAVDSGRKDNNFWHIDAAKWAKINGQSVDCAILEKTDQIACLKFSGFWSDLGDWNAVAKQLPRDKKGNFITKTANQIDCHNTTLWSTTDGTQLVGLGLKNIVTVVMNDAVLVADAGRMQDVRDVVDHLAAKDVAQAYQHATDYRPWGWFEILITQDDYQVKRLHVSPGATLSLQSHKHRSEHWVVVSGVATVTRGVEEIILEKNQSIFIQIGQKHRLANKTKEPLTVIEVQTGSYIGEDDIIRYEDFYNRS